MKKTILCLLFGTNCLTAQHSVNTSGGIGTGTGGSFGFSIGQPDYVSVGGANGWVTQGVQQPFDLVVLGTDAVADDSWEFNIYPNPTCDLLYIKNEDPAVTFTYQMFDLTGKMLTSSAPTTRSGQIDMRSFHNGTYVFIIQANNHLAKSYKVIKK